MLILKSYQMSTRLRKLAAEISSHPRFKLAFTIPVPGAADPSRNVTSTNLTQIDHYVGHRAADQLNRNSQTDSSGALSYLGAPNRTLPMTEVLHSGFSGPSLPL